MEENKKIAEALKTLIQTWKSFVEEFKEKIITPLREGIERYLKKKRDEEYVVIPPKKGDKIDGCNKCISGLRI